MGRKKVKSHNFLSAIWTAMVSFGLLYLVTETALYRKITTDSMFACTKLCELDGHNVLQLSMDVCLCDGEEGHKAADGYYEVLNRVEHSTCTLNGVRDGAKCNLPNKK